MENKICGFIWQSSNPEHEHKCRRTIAHASHHQCGGYYVLRCQSGRSRKWDLDQTPKDEAK